MEKKAGLEGKGKEGEERKKRIIERSREVAKGELNGQRGREKRG